MIIKTKVNSKINKLYQFKYIKYDYISLKYIKDKFTYT